jgi:hypothetical protein
MNEDMKNNQLKRMVMARASTTLSDSSPVEFLFLSRLKRCLRDSCHLHGAMTFTHI